MKSKTGILCAGISGVILVLMALLGIANMDDYEIDKRKK